MPVRFRPRAPRHHGIHMPILRCRHNYGCYILGLSNEPAGVVMRNGETRYIRWLGFMDLEEAKRLKDLGQARPVKLRVEAYSMNELIFGPWTYLKEGEFIQGALVYAGVYAVTVEGVPRVIR